MFIQTRKTAEGVSLLTEESDKETDVLTKSLESAGLGLEIVLVKIGGVGLTYVLLAYVEVLLQKAFLE